MMHKTDWNATHFDWKEHLSPEMFKYTQAHKQNKSPEQTQIPHCTCIALPCVPIQSSLKAIAARIGRIEWRQTDEATTGVTINSSVQVTDSEAKKNSERVQNQQYSKALPDLLKWDNTQMAENC